MKKIITILCVLIFSISNAQETNKNVSILKKWSIEDLKDFSSKTIFKITEKGKTKTVCLNLNNQTVELKNSETKKIIEKYVNKIPTTIIPKANCQQQEAAQWKYYNKIIYPTLLKNANLTCKAQRYCLVIYCNGIARTAYMLLIQPTAKCPVEEITYNIPD